MNAQDASKPVAPTDTNPDKLEVAPGTVHEGIEGWVPELANEDDLRVANDEDALDGDDINEEDSPLSSP